MSSSLNHLLHGISRARVNLRVITSCAVLCMGLATGAACDGAGGDGDPGADGAGPSPIVELGTGSSDFQPLTDGGDIQVVQGPQGGYHLFGSARISGLHAGDPGDLMAPDNPTTSFRAYLDGQRIDADISTYVQGYQPVPGTEASELTSRFVILDIADDNELSGREIVFEVEVTDTSAITASDTRTLIAVPHPSNI